MGGSFDPVHTAHVALAETVIAEDDTVLGIREHKDATEAEREIREINSGIYAFDAAALRDALAHVTADNAQGEMYLTDVLALARDAGGRVAAVQDLHDHRQPGAERGGRDVRDGAQRLRLPHALGQLYRG